MPPTSRCRLCDRDRHAGRATFAACATPVLYDKSNVVQEIASDGSTSNLLTGLGVDETLTRSDASGTNTLLVDALGSTLALANSSGVVQTNYTYEPFGNGS